MLGNFVHLYYMSSIPGHEYSVKTIDLRLDNGLMELILAIHSLPHYVKVDYEVTSSHVPSKRWNKAEESWEPVESVKIRDDDTFERP